jgi:putative transposase
MNNQDDPQEELALFRHGLVAPLLRRRLVRGEQAALLRKLAAQMHEIPGSRRTTVTIRTLKRYLQQARTGSRLAALKRKVRSDKGTLRSMPAEVLELAKRFKAEKPERSIPHIIDSLERAGHVAPGVLKESTLRRHLAAAGFTGPLLTGERKTYERWERERPADLWQGDASPGLYIPDPAHPGQMVLTQLLVLVDDHSRLCVGARFYLNQQQAALDDCFKRAVVRWGIPIDLYVDNGKIFISRHFRRVCADLKVYLIPASAYYPEGKGKIERLIGNLKDHFYIEAQLLIQSGRITTLEQLNEYLSAWIDEGYNRKHHSEIGMTPAQRWGSEEPIYPITDLGEVQEIFLWRKRTTVDKTCCFKLEGNRYQVDAALARQVVEVAYDPFDLSQVQVWHQGKRAQVAQPLVLKSRVSPKVHKPAAPPADATGISYLDLIRQAHEERLAKEAQGLQFRAMDPASARTSALPTLMGWVQFLEQHLGRPLKHLELQRVGQVWAEIGPIDPRPRTDRFIVLVASRGADHHIDTYLNLFRPIRR